MPVITPATVLERLPRPLLIVTPDGCTICQLIQPLTPDGVCLDCQALLDQIRLTIPSGEITHARSPE